MFKQERVSKKLSLVSWGIDNDESVLKTARENARRAGVDTLIDFSQADASNCKRPEGFENRCNRS